MNIICSIHLFKSEELIPFNFEVNSLKFFDKLVFLFNISCIESFI